MSGTARSLLAVTLSLGWLLVIGCVKECVCQKTVVPKKADNRLTSKVDRGLSGEAKTVLSLGGPYCEFYLVDVEAALKKVPGVIRVDTKVMQGHVIVSYEGGNVHPHALLSAVSSVRGDGYYCKAKVIPG